jgi:uncharacterized protein (UPF0548 family)
MTIDRRKNQGRKKVKNRTLDNEGCGTRVRGPESRESAIAGELFALEFRTGVWRVLCLSKPSRNSIEAFIAAQRDGEFSYADVGASRGRAPKGYTVDHNRIDLGRGAEAFERAKGAVRQWKMFDMDWVELCWAETAIEAGACVAVVISHLGFWSVNACRIVYVVEEHGAMEKFGFAYGTLAKHGEMGEERFTVEFNREDQTVWYDVYAFSRPRALAQLAYPFTRTLQRRFARDSKAAMLRAIQGG